MMAGMQSANRMAMNRIAAERATVGQPVARAAALARVDANEESGLAAYTAIRGGTTNSADEAATGNRTVGTIREIAAYVSSAGDGAKQIAAANAELDAAEAAFKEASKPVSVGGGGGGRAESSACKHRAGALAPQ